MVNFRLIDCVSIVLNVSLWLNKSRLVDCEQTRGVGKVMMKEKILIIDDEARFSASLDYLLKAEGYQVQVANCGEAAFALLQQQTFSVALVDINLPDFSGNLIAARIREEHPGTAIIILTGTLRGTVVPALIAAALSN